MRYKILALIALATTLNYLDRSLIGIAAPQIRQDLQLEPTTLGVLFSVFSWSYALAQLPGGWLLDRLGTRRTYFLSLALWSATTALHSLASGLRSLFTMRLMLGVSEAPCFPANSRVLVTWFPQRERARANSVYSVGMYVGIAFLSPALYWITARFGWRSLFAAIGLLGLAYSLVWWRLYREPGDAGGASASELEHIRAGGALAEVPRGGKVNWAVVGWLLRQRQVVGASIGQFATNATLVFFLTWFPSYLAMERGMVWLKAGFYTVLPFIAASVGVLVGGQLSDALTSRGLNHSFARKLPVVSGLLLSTSIALAMFVKNDALVIAIMSVAFFGQGMSNLGWTLISEVAPAGFVGLTAGVFNFFTNLAGILTPIAIGVIVQRTGTFVGALGLISVMAAIGVLAYVFILGDVRRIVVPDHLLRD